MKAQPRFGLTLSWLRVTIVFLIDIAILVVAGRLPDHWQPAAWWTGVAIAAAMALFVLIAYRGISVPSALAGWVWDWSADPGAALTAACTPAVDHRRRYGREAVGVREYRQHLVAVLAVDESDAAPSGRHQRAETSSGTLPVAAVAAGLRQFDVQLDGVDIVSVGTRATASQGGPDGKQRGAHRRSTWLVLRLDPQRNFTAVATRDSVASTLAAAAERLSHDLSGRRCAAWPISGDEFGEADSAVLAGLQPTWSRPGWRRLKHFNGYATSFWVSPKDITSQTLEQLWLPDVDATVLTVRLTAHHGRHQVSVWVRYHSDHPLPKTAWAGLNPLTGRQLAAVRASLPAPAPRPVLTIPARELTDDDLVVPLGPVHSRLGRIQVHREQQELGHL